MPKFRKRPIVIEAEQFTSEHMPAGIEVMGEMTKYFWLIVVRKLGAEIGTEVNYGDWIIKGVDGEKHCISDEIFRLTYEEVIE